ncbi:unnamed protein product [Prunus armeniaca]
MRNLPIDHAVGNPQSLERIGKNHVHRASGVNQHPTHVVIGDLGPNDHWVVVGVDDPLLIFFTKCDGLPSHLRQLSAPIVLYAEDMRAVGGTYILLHRTVRGSRQGGAAADRADHVDLPICVRCWGLWWPGKVLFQLSFPNQTLDNFPQTDAVFGIVAVLLVVSAEFANVPIILPTGLSVGWLWDLVMFVH